MRHQHTSALATLTLLSAIAIACANQVSKDEPLATVEDASTDSQGGGIAPVDAGDPGLRGDVSVTADSVIDEDSSCASESFDGTRIPPNLLVLLDRSGSMKGAKWTGTTNALNSLVTKSADDMKFGLKFFAYPDTTSCSVDMYAKPEVPVAALSTTRSPMQCWMGTASGCSGITPVTPGADTPMNAALAGAIKYMKTTYVGEGTRVVILMTDGDPNGCGTIDDVITTAATAPAAPDPKVLVYVIGAPGGTVANLSRVAAAGGGKRTPTCTAATSDPTLACNYQIGDATFEKDLLAALEDIKGKALTCTFKLPTGGDAGTIDPAKVNVNFTDGSGKTVTLSKDPSHANGWDYSDGGTTVTVYGPDCDVLKTDGKAKVQIVLGCKTKGPA
jgi:hypothetical protein